MKVRNSSAGTEECEIEGAPGGMPQAAGSQGYATGEGSTTYTAGAFKKICVSFCAHRPRDSFITVGTR